MKRIVMIFLGLSLTAFGMSYKQFKKYTQRHAKVLQSQVLSLQTTQVENKTLLRSKNPTLGFEAAHFNPKSTNSGFQYAGSITQNIRTGNYYGGLEEKASALSLLQEAYVLDGKAGYIRDLEKLYTTYVYQSKLLSLLKKEYKLSQKITNIIKIRYKNGSQNKVAYLQAKTNTITLKTQMFTTKEEVNTIYYQLLAMAGLKKKVALEKKFIYPVSKKLSRNIKSNTKQQILTAKKKLLESQMRMNESSIESYDIYASIEDEVDQSIFRVGVSLPLPIFNDKSEEKMLARLQKEQLKLDREQLDVEIYTQTQMIQSSINELSQQYQALLSLKKEQQVLNDLLQEGHKISQGSIFVMMNAKNKLIQTQKSLLQTQRMINIQKIDLRFIQGQYND